MNRAIQPCRVLLCALLLLIASTSASAQQKAQVPSRVVEAVTDTQTVTLKGNVHPWARTANDEGAVADSQPLTRMLLVLQRSSAQEQTLHQLMEAQQVKGSASYHAWLTPEQFGAQFGPSDSDVQAVTDWLTRQGFSVANVAKGKSIIEFSGTAGQVRNAFHTEIHHFSLKGQEYFANTADPAIPEALSSVIAGVAALHNFPKSASIVHSGVYRRYKGSSTLNPLFTYGNPAFYAMGPGDFAKIYNIPTTATGAGQSIAVLGQTNINPDDVTAFRSMFGLPAYSASCSPGPCFQVVLNGPDPGIANTGDEGESDLDVQWSGAVAPMANIYLVVTQSTLSNPNQVSQGVDLSALYAVDNNLAPVISDSYGSCEPFLLTAGNQFYNALWEQAAAQGITVSVAAGDTGPAACDPNTEVDPYAASQGVAVSGLASTPYNVAVGGTDFAPSTTGNPTYWNNTSDTVNSALQYIPETTWDDSACALNYPTTPCTTVDQTNSADLSAGGGGLSNCISATSDSSGNITCSKSNGLYGYTKPAFQTGLTPADSVRDIPDVSFFASNGGPFTTGAGVAYVTCQSDSNPSGVSCNLQTPYTDFSLVGGTSASTPAFAAVMALVNAQTGQRQGNANYVLYNLANSDTNYTGGKCVTSNGSTPQAPAAACVFNDVNSGNNSVACDAGTANCSNTSTSSGGYGVIICSTSNNSNTLPNQVCPAVDNANPAFQSTSKYDLATGLGSINVGNLLAKWTSAIRTATTTSLTSPSGGLPSGTNFTATISVSPSPANGEPVSLNALDSSGNVLGSVGPFSLSGGSVSVKTNLLPPNTASVQGTYGGDAILAASVSTPVSIGPVSGTGQSSTVTVYFVSISSGGVSNPTTSSQNFQYGSAGYILKVVVTGSNGSCSFAYPNTKPANPCPTGTISLFANGTALNDFSNGTTNTTALNNQGFVEDQPINLNVGAYKITATYSGDPNYSASTNSNSLSVTLTQAPTSTSVASSLTSITAGQTVTLSAIVATQSGGNGPTGTVTFTNNGNSVGTATCTPTTATSSTPAYCTATLNNVAISSLYGPPTGSPRVPRVPLLIALLSMLVFVLGLRFIPQTRRRAYTYAGLFAVALLVGVIAGCGGGGGGGGGGGSTRTIGASYPGDTNYTKSAGTTTIQIQ
jgi:hypothetical protein